MIRLLRVFARGCWRLGAGIERRLDRAGDAAWDIAWTLETLEAEVERMVREAA